MVQVSLLSAVIGVVVPMNNGAADPPVYDVLLLHFDDAEARDTSGADAVGENQGATPGAEGRFGKAWSLDGADDYVDMGDRFGLTYCLPEQTVELWVRPAAERASSIIGSVDNERGGSWRWYVVRNANSTLSLHHWDNSRPRDTAHAILTSEATAATGRWTHVAFTIDSVKKRQVALYVDGEMEATGPAATNSPHGRLIIGAGHEGFFAGCIDEVHIMETALSAGQIRANASRTEALPDGRAFQAAGDGFALRPWGDHTDVQIRHPAFPRTVWRLQVTEWGYHDPNAGQQVRARNVAWETDDERKALRYHWGAEEALKRRVGLDFEGRLEARDDCIDFEITVRNIGDGPWEHAPMQLVCLRSGPSPAFEDYEAKRTWVQRDGEWHSVNERLQGKFADHRMCGLRPVGEGDGEYERLSAKTSLDGEWALGLAVDRADSLSFNFQSAVSCIHSNPAWGSPGPGEEVTARGRVYLVRGGLDELYGRYREDFAD